MRMKRFFYIGIILLVLFEFANVYFIMPMPYSQAVRSIDLAYLLYSFRWIFRTVFGTMIVAGASSAWRTARWRKAPVLASLAIAAVVAYTTNFRMASDHMFLAPASLRMQPAEHNTVAKNRLVVGVEVDGQARA